MELDPSNSPPGGKWKKGDCSVNNNHCVKVKEWNLCEKFLCLSHKSDWEIKQWRQLHEKIQ